jgi:rhodanese-related sulfurtransferase
MKKLLCALLVVIILAGCQSRAVTVTGETISATGGSYKNVTPKELSTMLKDKDFVLVNVHIPFAGNLPNTDLSIPYDKIDQNLSQLPADKAAKVVLYCRSGRMSQIAAENLVSQGYTNVWNLQGGMVDWEKEGFEIQK